MKRLVNLPAGGKPWRILGLTGGIASGKSTACTYLESQGHTQIIDADEIARDLTRKGKPLYQEIVHACQHVPDLLLADQELNRSVLNAKAFEEPEFLRWLEARLHPAIGLEIERRLEALRASSDLIILSAPLLFETGLEKACLATLLIDCPVEQQIQRLAQRNQYTADQARKRLAQQMPASQKRQRATWIVENNGSIADLHRELDLLLPTIQRHFKS